MATVTLTSEARKQFSELPRTISRRIEKLLSRLADWPQVSGVKHLRDDLAGKCRMRTGDYRIQFYVAEAANFLEQKTIKGKEKTTEREITEYAIVVEKIGHRDGFY